MAFQNRPFEGIAKLRDDVRQRLAQLQVQAKPIVGEIARLERLAQSLDDMVGEPLETRSHAMGTVRAVAPPPVSISHPRGESTPHDSFTFPILDSLDEQGGKGSRDGVLRKLEDKMKNQLKPGDFETIKNGTDLRWRNRASFQRKNMIIQGLLRNDSPYGIWEMSSAGRQYLDECRKLLQSVFGEDKSQK
jgi:hypothetical protein